jgi:hypothetical protein
VSVTSTLIDELRQTHGFHTLLLYGSHARGDATSESDIDLAGFSDRVEVTVRDARHTHGVFLDGFVYPTSVAQQPPDLELLKLRGATILLDERGLAGPLLAAIEALDRRGPTPLTPDDAQMRRVWATKMLARIRRDDLEARYRRHWLLYQLLEDYFALRGHWYRGPKEALRALVDLDPAALVAFERALAPDAPLAALDALVAHVIASSPTS